MAEEEKEEPEEEQTGEEEEAPNPGKKKGIFLGGGIIGLVALAYCTFLMAVPSVEQKPELAGPFVAELLANEISVNLTGNNNSHYLAVRLKAEYTAYEELYVTTRVVDPLYEAVLTDKTIVVLSGKTKDDVDGAAGKDMLREELREALEPILFPVHVGFTLKSTDPDMESGLRLGVSGELSTMRGLIHDHVIHVDAPGKTLALDEGEEIPFDGTENDLRLVDAQGETLYVDVTALDPDLVGEVSVGVFGRIRSVYFSKFISQ
ncbi:MAG: flagellar basal body-associated FliL family protein [Planctomycetota bacterium]